MRSSVLGIFAFLFLTSLPAGVAGPITSFKVDNWVGGGFTNDQTGAFDHCAMGARYRNGVTLHVSIMANGQWLLGMSNQSWSLAAGQTFPIDLTFDGRGSIRVYAVPRNKTLYVIAMPPNGQVINAFRSARLMQAFINGQLLGFELNDTNRLFGGLQQCVRTQGASMESAGAVVAPPHSPVATPFSAPGAPMQQPPANSGMNPEAKAERDKLLTQAAAEYGECIKTQMRTIVPFSNENAETLAQVILTKCEEAENKFVSLGMALTNKSRAEIQTVMGQNLAKQKASIVAEIVSLRAELAKSLLQQNPQPQPSAPVAPAQKDPRNAI